MSVVGYRLGRAHGWARPVAAGIVAVALAAVVGVVADAHGLTG